jgi:glucan phosphoethanolaminetransferase (alkaline phosphatase superfamily)
MPDALIIAAVLFVLIALWGAVVFLMGWKESADTTRNQLRRFWIVVSAACGIALLMAVFIRTMVSRNAAVEESTQLALRSPPVQHLLGSPIHYPGFRRWRIPGHR